ncbi:hypothetical protein AVEN_146930-1 [Araneus ventricosus]|uniref:Uncharacterized protein n=1 Tax=Araneus ventricosus TaxID=182803 RepID=A0A4Y2HDH0_ARAVE|nr:hypothetical protein AVEN_40873-1 [Araneus ventricosus]GBM63343.1 hypothetical protein AVEN_146930-1 [Araneus ventricosus]
MTIRIPPSSIMLPHRGGGGGSGWNGRSSFVAGADDASVPSAPLTYLELFSRAKSRKETNWLFHRCITGIKVLDQVAVYQLTASDATKQFLLASLLDISEV